MQIHELNKKTINEAIVGPGGVIDTIKNTAKTLTKPGAAKALAQATPTDTADLTQTSWMDMYRQTESDRATQTWIDGLLKQYRAQMGRLPVPQTQSATTAPPTQTAEPTQDMYLGGKKLDPKNPKDAEVIKKIQAQGLKEAADLTPDQIAQQFQSWSDQYLNTQSITMDQVRKSVSPLKPLAPLLNKLARAQAAGATQAFDQAFREYMLAATTGIRMLTKQANQASPQAQTTRTQQYTTAPGAMDIRQQLQAVGISNQQLLKLGQLVTAANNGEVRSTGNPAVDDVLRNMGIKI